MGAIDGSEDATAFVERFAAGWAGGADGFFEHFLPVIDEQVVLRQPLLPPARGHDGFREVLGAAFAAIPDLRGEVLGWRPEPDGVTIDLALRGTLDGLPVAWVTHDRIVLHEGRMLERHARFSPVPLLVAALRRPRRGLPLIAAPLLRSARAKLAFRRS